MFQKNNTLDYVWFYTGLGERCLSQNVHRLFHRSGCVMFFLVFASNLQVHPLLISRHRYKGILCVPVARLMRVVFRFWSLSWLVVNPHATLIVLASSCKEGQGHADCQGRGFGAHLVVVLRVWKRSKQTIHIQPWGQDFRGWPAQGVPVGQSLVVTGVSLSTRLPVGQFSITYWISCWNNMISSCLLELRQ